MVQRNLQKIRIFHGACQNAHVHFGLPQFILDGVGKHLLRHQGNGWELFSDDLEQAGNQHGRNRGNQCDPERAGKQLFFRLREKGDLVRIVNGDLRLVDDLPPDSGGGDGMDLPVEEGDVQFFFQLLDHQA